MTDTDYRNPSVPPRWEQWDVGVKQDGTNEFTHLNTQADYRWQKAIRKELGLVKHQWRSNVWMTSQEGDDPPDTPTYYKVGDVTKYQPDGGQVRLTPVKQPDRIGAPLSPAEGQQPALIVRATIRY